METDREYSQKSASPEPFVNSKMKEAPSKFFKQQEIDFAQSKPTHPLIADSDHSGYHDFKFQSAKP